MMVQTAVPAVRRRRATVVLMLSSLCIVAAACADAQAKHDGSTPALTSTSAQPVTTLGEPATTVKVHPSTSSSEPAATDVSSTVAQSPNVYAATGVDGLSPAVSNDKAYAYV